jgi:hypothetical protein
MWRRHVAQALMPAASTLVSTLAGVVNGTHQDVPFPVSRFALIAPER